jgi:hypothetical protein
MRVLVLLTGLSTALAACGPAIHRFAVTPSIACQGDTVSVTFDVRGTPRLLTLEFEHEGSPATRYILIAERRGRQQYRVQDVLHYAERPHDTVAFDTEVLGADSVRAVGTLRPEDRPTHVQIREAWTDAGRVVVVSHGGRSGPIGPDSASSTLWRGLPVAGDWELKAAIAPGEEAGNPDHPPPDELAVNLTLSCG